MKRSKFTEAQIAFAIRQSETGTKVEMVCRKMGISEATARSSSPRIWISGHTGEEVELVFSRPGKPTDNPYIESFNGSFREECLNTHWFLSLEDTKEKIEVWREEYNTFQPHSCLGDMTPEMFIESQVNKAGSSTLG